MKIGIPRALLYYWYGHEWESFWRDCGVEVVVSGPTDRSTIEDGAKVALDELCLPVKIFLGHVIKLAKRVDRIMIPHLIKVEPNAYICPKFMGLPDVVRHTLPELVDQLLIVKVGPKQVDHFKAMQTAAGQLGIKIKNQKSKVTGLNPALKCLNNLSKDRTHHQLTIGILGHPYCVYDSCFNLNLLKRLTENNVNIITPEMLPESCRGIGAGKLEKELFWTVGRYQFDALEWMLHGAETQIDGFIQVMPFACGPEAIVGDLLERRIKQAGKPLLKLSYEEHSGEAGVITRLEAFLDLIRYRSKVC